MVAYRSFTPYRLLVAPGAGFPIFGSRFNNQEPREDQEVAIDQLEKEHGRQDMPGWPSAEDLDAICIDPPQEWIADRAWRDHPDAT